MALGAGKPGIPISLTAFIILAGSCTPKTDSEQSTRTIESENASAEAPGQATPDLSLDDESTAPGEQIAGKATLRERKAGGPDPETATRGARRQRDRPWAHNTGPSNPGVLRPMGTQTITTDGAVLENVDLTGTLTIDADNVTVRNFRVHGSPGTVTGYGIRILDGHSGIVLEDGEIYDRGTGIYGVGWTGRRLYIHDMGGDGTKAQGTGGPVLMEYSFIEKLGKKDGAHADGNQTIGAPSSAVLFRYNNCWMPAVGPNSPGAPYKSNACFMNSAGATLDIEYNWLNGGNYTVFCAKSGEPSGPVNLRYNRFGRDYRYGTHSGACGQVIGNVWDDTGEPI